MQPERGCIFVCKRSDFRASQENDAEMSCNDKTALQGYGMPPHSCCDAIPYELPPLHSRRTYFIYKDPDVSHTRIRAATCCVYTTFQHIRPYPALINVGIPHAFSSPMTAHSSLGLTVVRNLSIQPEAPWAANFLILA